MINEEAQLEICEQYFCLPRSSLPDNPELLAEAMIAESYRIALAKLSYNSKSESFEPVHILSLRSWVIRKIRSIIPQLDNKEEDLMRKILKGKGPNLEFLGDMLLLPEGKYLPAPTRLINIDDTNHVIVSGLPTYMFRDKGIDVRILGVGRWMIGTPDEEIALPTQELYSYIDFRYNEGTPSDYIENIISQESEVIWPGVEGFEPYSGIIPGRNDFEDVWDEKERSVVIGDNMVELWRCQREWEMYDYWLKISRKLKTRQEPILKIDRNGNKYWFVPEYEISGIKLNHRQYKYVILALDRLNSKPRTVSINSYDSKIILTMNFNPPASIWRLLHSHGAIWKYSSSGISCSIPGKSFKVVTLLEKVGFQIIDYRKEV